MWGRRSANSDYNPKQLFNHELAVEKGGKKIIWKTFIEAANEDVEPYQVFEKYNCLEKIKVDIDTVHGDFKEYEDLRTNLDREIKAKEMWEALPWDVRKEFGNDINAFRDHGGEWINQKRNEQLELIKKEREKIEKQEELRKQLLAKEVAAEIEKGAK